MSYSAFISRLSDLMGRNKFDAWHRAIVQNYPFVTAISSEIIMHYKTWCLDTVLLSINFGIRFLEVKMGIQIFKKIAGFSIWWRRSDGRQLIFKDQFFLGSFYSPTLITTDIILNLIQELAKTNYGMSGEPN